MIGNESGYFHGLVEKLAYQLWEKQGRPLGSSEQDWFRAEASLRHHLGPSSPPGDALPPLSAVFLEPNPNNE
jgi:hypothetical protein